MAANLLLLSSSTVSGSGFLEYALGYLEEFLGDCRLIHFVPFARNDHNDYTASVQKAFSQLGVKVVGLHTFENPVKAVEQAEVLFVGGGNSFRLLKAFQQKNLVEPVRRRVESGKLRFMGSSAGTNMACPTLRTTNDMPIVQPVSFEAIGLVPFQINPHYHDPDPSSNHMGETREERIREFLQENDVAVLGLREGALLRQKERELKLEGVAGARLFRRRREPVEFAPGGDLSWLLEEQPRFDFEA